MTPLQPRRSLVSRLFGREPDPHRPLDLDYVQTRWVRLYRPGPWRVAVLVPGVLLLAFSTTVFMVAALSVRGQLVNRLAVLLLGAAVLALLGMLVTRFTTAGVYVNDGGIKVLRILGSTVLPWRTVVDVRRVPGPQPVLGLPGLTRDGERVQLVLRDGSDLRTPIATLTADFAGRAEAYDIAALALDRWWQAGRTAA